MQSRTKMMSLEEELLRLDRQMDYDKVKLEPDMEYEPAMDPTLMSAQLPMRRIKTEIEMGRDPRVDMEDAFAVKIGFDMPDQQEETDFNSYAPIDFDDITIKDEIEALAQRDAQLQFEDPQQDSDNSVTPQSHKCQQCARTFAKKSNLTRHLKLHNGTKPFTCLHCPQSYTYKSSLQKHLVKHSGTKPYSCEHCFQTYTDNSSLKKHLVKHTGNKPFSCSFCESSFIDRSSLLIHHRRHTGEKPYSCDICSSAFTTKSYLNKHKFIHTGQKPFACSYCPVAYADRSNLKKHQQLHVRRGDWKLVPDK